MKTTRILVVLLLSAGTAWAQLPQCTAVPGWKQQGENRKFETDSLFEYMDGNSEGYFLYGFQVMNGVTCRSGEKTIDIDVSAMVDPEYAYGMFTSTVDPRLPVEKIGTMGQVTPRRAIFAKDKFYVELAASPEGDHTETIRAYMTIIEKSISGQTTLPAALEWFPKEELVAGSVRLVPQSVLGVRLLRKGYMGQYSFGRGFVVQESSPEAAADVMAKLKARFGQTTPQAIADEGFTGTDKYLSGVCVFRKGSFVGGFANLQAGRDGVAETTKLAATLK